MKFTKDILGTAPSDFNKRSPYRIRPLLSTDRNDIIEWLRESHLIENYCQKLEGKSSPYLYDIISEIYLLLLELPEDKWNDLINQGANAIRAYVSGMIFRNIKSNTSIIYKKYKRIDRYQVHMTPELWLKFNETGIFPKNDDKISVQERITNDDIIRNDIENDLNSYEKSTRKTKKNPKH